MAGLLEDAIDELYAAEPDAFTDRRDALTASARAGGDALAAKQIAALRKPTRAAWLMNTFARAHPDRVAQLSELGEQMRSAQRAMNGAQLRELSARRRRLISAAVADVLAAGGSEAMRAPVTATLEAALADPDLAAEVAAGALVRPLEYSGFGDAAPSLTVVPMPAPKRITSARDHPKAAAKAAAAARAVATAEVELAAASAAVAAADVLREAASATIARLEDDLVQARFDLRAAGAQQRAARARERDAQRRLRRARGEPT